LQVTPLIEPLEHGMHFPVRSLKMVFLVPHKQLKLSRATLLTVLVSSEEHVTFVLPPVRGRVTCTAAAVLESKAQLVLFHK
jgi:hypothetical protein